jgi:hypothetical protein
MSEELKSCPFCGSENVEDDYSGSTATFDGKKENPTGYHEYQYGWVDCLDCKASSGEVQIDHQHQSFSLSEAVAKKWNIRN